MEMIACGLGMAPGLFVAAFPAQTAKVWASRKLDTRTPTDGLWSVRCWRMFGVLLGISAG
jgi:hypothetical protein